MKHTVDFKQKIQTVYSQDELYTYRWTSKQVKIFNGIRSKLGYTFYIERIKTNDYKNNIDEWILVLNSQETFDKKSDLIKHIKSIDILF